MFVCVCSRATSTEKVMGESERERGVRGNEGEEE